MHQQYNQGPPNPSPLPPNMGSTTSGNTSNTSMLSASMRTHMGIQDNMRQFKQDEITKWSGSGGSGALRDEGNMGRGNQGGSRNAHQSDKRAHSNAVAGGGGGGGVTSVANITSTPLLNAAKDDLLFPFGTAWDNTMDDNIFEFLEGMSDLEKCEGETN
mmetsp:Transcript_23190/g.48126  ORF Transcript_23190/g.48126 Transcript_23190/m.48126 type:complete len:159 (+) Transcript_23190:296-772(+)